MKKPWHIDRRHMLRGIGATVALPLLDAMLPNSRAMAKEIDGIAPSVGALGAEGQRVRFTGIFMPNGFDLSRLVPKRSNLDELSPILTPLEGLQEYVNVITNMTSVGEHARGTASVLTGGAPVKTQNASDIDLHNPSIDQIIGQATRNTTSMPSLELGTHVPKSGVTMQGVTEIYNHYISYRTRNIPVPFEIDPMRALDRLFKGAKSSNKNSGSKKESNIIAPNKSVLDLIMGSAKSLQRRLGHSDKLKLEQYLTAVREIEQKAAHASANSKEVHITTDILTEIKRSRSDIRKSYGGVSKGSANNPTEANLRNNIKTVPDLSYEDHIRLQFEIIALALWTNTTRSATLTLGGGAHNRNASFIEGVSGGMHGASHHGYKKENLEMFSKVNTFFIGEYARFLRRLEGMKEGSSNVLENSICYMSTNISEGQRHRGYDMPAIIAGHAGGGLRGNRHIDAERAPRADLLRSILHEMKIREKLGDSNNRLKGLS